MSVIVIGADPGDSMGISIIRDTELFHAFQGSPEDALTLVELTIGRFDDPADLVTVACERYVNLQTGRRRTHQPTAQRASGALEHIARHHAVGFVSQSPADAHAVASNELLQRIGMYQTNLTVGQRDADDANMAVRHALLYLSHTHATLFHAILRKHGVMT